MIGCLGAVLIIGAWILIKSLIGAGIDYANYKSEEHKINQENDKRETLFIKYLSVMSAKIAKADGTVSDIERTQFYDAFHRLGFSSEKISVCKEYFQRGLDSDKSIFNTAYEFKSKFTLDSERPLRELLYHVLCYISLADEWITNEELYILKRLPEHLEISKDFFIAFCNDLGIDPNSKKDQKVGSYQQKSDVDPYEILGVSRELSDDELKKAYHEKVRNYHPDILRGKGVPEEMLSFANEEMAKINEAWAQIKEERHIS